MHMAAYVDGFLLTVPKKNVKAYAKMSKAAGKVWMKYGALQYCEAAGDDLKTKMGVPFAKAAKAKPNETVVFSWILYKSRKHRDAVNKKVMKDPYMLKMMSSKDMPFNPDKMSYGGFKLIVDM